MLLFYLLILYLFIHFQRHTDFEAASGLIRGIYDTVGRYPYIVHMQHFKTLATTCQVSHNIIFFTAVL